MFTPTSAPLRADQPRAACADRLDLVDAAFVSPGKGKRGEEPKASDELAILCRTCPVASECLTHAMTHPEAGVWAGTSPNMRARHGAPKTGHA